MLAAGSSTAHGLLYSQLLVAHIRAYDLFFRALVAHISLLVWDPKIAAETAWLPMPGQVKHRWRQQLAKWF